MSQAVFAIYNQNGVPGWVNIVPQPKTLVTPEPDILVGEDGEEILIEKSPYWTDTPETAQAALIRLLETGRLPFTADDPHFLYEGDLPEYPVFDFATGNVIAGDPPAPVKPEVTADAIKTICRERIYAQVSAPTQMNLVAYRQRIEAQKPAGYEAEIALLDRVYDWIMAMKTKCGSLIAANEQDPDLDEHWLVFEDDLAAFVARF